MGELGEFYRKARVKFDADPGFADRARQRVVLLQSGDAATLDLWRTLIDISKRHFTEIYAKLGVLLVDEDIRGESFYNPLLADVAADLERRGIATINDGALCVFPPGFTNRDGQPLPLIVRKQDGGYGCGPDLAALRYRPGTLRRALLGVGGAANSALTMVLRCGSRVETRPLARASTWPSARSQAGHAQGAGGRVGSSTARRAVGEPTPARENDVKRGVASAGRTAGAAARSASAP